MNRTVSLLTSLLTLSSFGTLALSALAQVSAVPNSMNFQGRLATPSGNPVPEGTYSVRFSLWDSLTGGTEKWNQPIDAVQVKNGVFAVTLNAFPAGTFNSNLWLEIKVGTDAALTPRQPLVTVPYAFKANSIKDGAITGASIANGTITLNKLNSTLLSSNVWLLGGNTLTGSPFLGSINNAPVEFRVNNRRTLRYSYAENAATAGYEYRSSNVLGGSAINSIAAQAVGATIAGGGLDFFTAADYPNRVTADNGTVGGGAGNTSGLFSTVAGGNGNTASGADAAIAGGISNTASGGGSSIGGGSGNTATGVYSTIGGGIFNSASGYNAIVAGGIYNAANGDYSFTAGQRAQANHAGSFVWNDASDLSNPFVSTDSNQFLVHAFGGVGINTNAPAGYALKVNGTVAASDFVQISDARYKTNINPLENPLATILNMRGVSYDWKRDDFKDMNFGAGRQIGFIAQELEKVLPELVHTDSKGYKAVNYIQVVPVLVEAVKAQQAQINRLKDSEKKNIELENRVKQLENLVERLLSKEK